MIEINRIYNEDCITTMANMSDGLIDLVVTSPPYDGLRKYNGYSFDFEKVAQELYRVVKIGGVIVWVVGDQTKDGSESGTSFRQALYFKELGLNLHDTMIYRKTNPVPLTHNRYEQCFEYMFVFTKGKLKTFNPIKEKCKTSGVYTHRRKSGRVSENSLRARDEATETKVDKIKYNIWEYAVGVKTDNGNHPAVFPEQLAIDHINSWSNAGELMCDPFMGSGTVAKQAKLLGRNFIGSEISKDYFDIAESRVAKL